jgi:xylulokinase
MKGLILGIDLGTSGVKCVLYDPEGKILGLGRASFGELASPLPGWAQSDPECWWRSTLTSLRQACRAARVSAADVTAVGLSVFFPAVIAMDSTARALYPAILYNDQRSLAQVRFIQNRVSADEHRRITGNVLVPGTAAVTSICWLREQEPGAYGAARVVGFANTFMGARLTGEFCTDPTMATFSGLADIREPERWSEPLCRALDIEQGLLPRIAASSEVIGGVTASASRETGLREGTPVVCGCGDAVASTFGTGTLEADTVVIISGTTDCITSPMQQPTEDLRWLNCAYVRPRSWLGIGAVTSSGASVQWFLRELLPESPRARHHRVHELAAGSPAGANGLLFLPYLYGERTPIWDPLARGLFLGLTGSTRRSDMARAVLEGVAFADRDAVSCLEEARKRKTLEIMTAGGGTRSALWNQIRADVLQKPLHVCAFQETGSLGAMLLAGLGTGLFSSAEEAAEVARSHAQERVVEPDRTLAGLYEQMFALYRKAYSSTCEIMHALAQTGRPSS